MGMRIRDAPFMDAIRLRECRGKSRRVLLWRE